MNRRRGQALVEFAMVLPLLLLLLMGLIEFGRAWNLHQVVTDASREGARHAVLQSGAATCRPGRFGEQRGESRTRERCGQYLQSEHRYRSSTPSTVAGEPVTVTVQVPYEFVFLGPMMSWFAEGWGGSDREIMLTARSTMRNE